MNPKHLRYFWAVGHAGSVSQAARQLHLTPQTVSAQIKLFEEELGAVLLRHVGRGLELTDAGRVALGYADEIFELSEEMVRTLRAQAGRALSAFRVGMADAVPRSLALRLLAPLSALSEPVRLICRQGQIEWMLSELALHRLDMVVADRPMPTGLAVRGHSHKLGESPMAFFATPEFAATCADFPACLNGAPILLPGLNTAVRGEVERWLAGERVAPSVVAEFDDSALMKAFAQTSGSIFPSPAVLSSEISVRYGVREIGRVETVRESFWIICTERRVSHPAVRAVLDAARAGLFAAV